MQTLKTLSLSLVLAGVCAGAWAGPSMVGASGNLFQPDTEVLPTQSLSASANFLWAKRAGTTEGNQWYSLSYGAIQNVEVGVSRLSYRTRKADDTLLQAKWKIAPEKGYLPSVAVGTLDLTNELGFNQATAYVVASHFLWSPMNEFTGEHIHPLYGSIGYGSGIYGGSFFGGLEWRLRKDAKVMVEYAKNRALGPGDALLTLGAQVTLAKRWTLNAAAVDMKDASVGVSYTMDSLF